jgi:uncharacterized OB-fold protein
MSTTPDPRPRVQADRRTVAGQSCPSCQWTTVGTIGRCAVCGTTLQATTFGPGGTLWSSTIVRVPVPGRTPPYAVGYVDLDAGPRVLCHLTADNRPPVGTRVAICGSTAEGDVLVEVAS